MELVTNDLLALHYLAKKGNSEVGLGMLMGKVKALGSQNEKFIEDLWDFA